MGGAKLFIYPGAFTDASEHSHTFDFLLDGVVALCPLSITSTCKYTCRCYFFQCNYAYMSEPCVSDVTSQFVHHARYFRYR